MPAKNVQTKGSSEVWSLVFFEIFRWIYSVQTKEQKSRPVTPSSWISLAYSYLPLNPDEWFALHAWTPHLGWFVWWTPRRLSLLKQTRPQSHGQKVHHPRCWKWKNTEQITKLYNKVASINASIIFTEENRALIFKGVAKEWRLIKETL